MEHVPPLSCIFECNDGAAPRLTLTAVAAGAALAPLLDVLLPPDCQLGSLRMSRCEFDPEAPCPRLAPLTRLELDTCSCDGSAARVPGLAWQTPRLRCLAIYNTPMPFGYGWHDDDLPGEDEENVVQLEAVAHLSLLTHLKLCALRLDSLPPGPYLQGEPRCRPLPVLHPPVLLAAVVTQRLPCGAAMPWRAAKPISMCQLCHACRRLQLNALALACRAGGA